MGRLDKLAKNIKHKQKKQKINSNKNFTVLKVLGVAIVGVVTGLFAHRCNEEIKNIIITNAKDIDEDIERNTDEDISNKRDEIKQTLEKVSDESIGDIGVEMKNALEDLGNEDEATK